MSSTPLPRLAVTAANAATILGVSKGTFQGLVDAGLIAPLSWTRRMESKGLTVIQARSQAAVQSA